MMGFVRDGESDVLDVVGVVLVVVLVEVGLLF
jgi:hypothetical protein